MIIKELIIKNFGACSGLSVKLKPGINIIYGENESGKSTVHSFIQSVFFGIRKMRGRAARTDDYNKFLPWENSGWYAGAVRFTCGDKDFLLERNFQKGMEQANLVCETDGELLCVEDGDLEMLLGNISETVYRNTVSVGQLKSRTGEELLQELRNYISGYEGSGDAFLDVKKALGILKERQKQQEQKLKDILQREEQTKRDLEIKINYLQEDMDNLGEKTEILDREIREYKQKLKTFSKVKDKPGEKKEEQVVSNKILKLCFVLLVLFTAAEIILWNFSKIPVKMILGAGILTAAIGLFGSLRFMRKAGDEDDEWDKRTGRLRSEILKKEAGRQELLTQMQQKSTELFNKKEELEEWGAAEEKAQIRKECQAIELAEKTIRNLAAEMQNSVNNALRAKVSRILCTMTEGKYREVIIDEEFHMTLLTEDRLIPLYQVSTGTIEQIYLALRMAVGEILCKEETMPVVLDETFAMYDDRRLRQTLKWLWEEKEQALIFTCNKREIQALKEEGIPFQVVEL